MARGRKAGLTKSKIKMLVYGEKFTGKSTFAMQAAYLKNEDGEPFKILYIDTENGSIDNYIDKLIDDGIDVNNIYILYTQSLEETNDYIQKVIHHETLYELDDEGNPTDQPVLDAKGRIFNPDCIVIDSATIFDMTVKQGLTNLSQKRAAIRCKKEGIFGDEKMMKIQTAGLEIKDYNLIKYKGQDLILTLNGCDKHVIITARETDEKVSVSSNGTFQSVSTGRKIPDGFKGMDYNVNTLVRLYRPEDDPSTVYAFYEKDRSGIHPDCTTVADPSIIEYQALIDKGVGRKEFSPGNSLTQAVQIAEEYAAKEFGEDAPTNNPNVLGSVKEEESNSETDSVEGLRLAISESLKEITNPVDKNNIKNTLKEKGLPTAFNKCTDIVALKNILDIVRSYK